MASKVLYLIGSLRNKRIPELAKRLREEHPDVEVFDDWYAAGPEADDFWKGYEQARGRSYQEALGGYAARNVFAFDKRNLDRCTHSLLVLPAGKSGHMEIMYATYGVGAKTAILLDHEDIRWDVMYQFVPTIIENDEGVRDWLNSPVSNTTTTSPDLNSYPAAPSKVWQQSLDLGLKNMPLITGGVASNTPGSSARLSDTSTLSTMAKTLTRKAR